ncbi:glycoside hydrolase family 2 TIM barrel-domain containing protein [Dysgonomonas sp. 25]|uniref:glycoside hydrolase family 2 protein n=1 Tax=Dysgonomonas sp. 25 TaxID=2302933 RepID=UPI0013D0F147|nr:glycoside hydrolase family 2 TIM barrel-domain containing protein [Dysgonomonas sp. 25]NDV69914.1 glycosyl hydrolase [Dysgonomonas sp. 25]
MLNKILFTAIALVLSLGVVNAQDRYELNSGWKCMPSTKTKDKGEKISAPNYSLSKWKKAVVPGTVLTTQLENGEIPDPFYGMNNEKIKDIYETGRDYYTYWFAKDFDEKAPSGDEQVWLTFRGINYSVEIYLNGKKVNNEVYEGMFLRKSFNITKLLAKDGKNRLAVIVYPPDPVGNPNGGQGGDGRIAKSLTHQYTAGWDWIQPIRDRNTGIWDKVYIEKTGIVNLKNPHIVTLVPGKRNTGAKQEDAILKVSAELQNTTNKSLSGVLRYEIDGDLVTQRVNLKANATVEVSLPDYSVKNPKLWWPAGYGEQNMYNIKIEFVEDESRKVQDFENVQFGIRELQFDWNEHTRSKQISVNGQKIFIKGGNWIISDAMLRFTPERYDAEIRYHRDMNLNLIRIWGGALTERPEFYEACDKYGMLVIQDFWFSGDCNGRWTDPLKAEDQWTRRKYPDNHALVLEAAEDMIKMIRNYPSLAFWCGGNEIMPPQDILIPLRDELLPRLDGTRWFADYSNSDEWSYNFIGGNGDGPYTIQPKERFWEHRTWPFNSEVGSVGVGDYESLVRFIPEKNLVAPKYNPNAKFKEETDDVWTYHTYTGVGYEGHLVPYGEPKDIKDFAMKAQLVNYDQYRALMEGFSSHMWDWYTGSIIWKTQNPWTSMRGQMYDYYLDPNACLFGLRNGSQPVHVMCNPVTKMVMVVNNSFEQLLDLTVEMRAYDMDGKETFIDRTLVYMEPSMSKNIQSVKAATDPIFEKKGGFLYLELCDLDKNVISRNLYWFPDANGEYSGLKAMPETSLSAKAKYAGNGKVEVSLTNPKDAPIAFFNRVSLIDSKTKDRVLPAFYDDNYVSVLPGETVTVTVDYTPQNGKNYSVDIYGWNVNRFTIPVQAR